MTFTLEQALKAQRALRAAAKLPDEQFPIQAFIGMLSDEIETLREQGRSDEEIAELINGSAGTDVPTAAVTENFAPAEQRRNGA